MESPPQEQEFHGPVEPGNSSYNIVKAYTGKVKKFEVMLSTKKN